MNYSLPAADKINDQLLVTMLRNNKAQAIPLLYEKYWKQLVCYAYTYLEDWDTSEEMVQQLFVRIYVKNLALSNELHLSSYLYRAVKNTISNHMRRQAIYHRHMLGRNETSIVSLQQIISGIESFDVRKKITHAIGCIPERSRIVYILNRDHQLTIKEIAKKLNRPEDTVDKQLRRAVNFLKKQLRFLLN